MYNKNPYHRTFSPGNKIWKCKRTRSFYTSKSTRDVQGSLKYNFTSQVEADVVYGRVEVGSGKIKRARTMSRKKLSMHVLRPKALTRI